MMSEADPGIQPLLGAELLYANRVTFWVDLEYLKGQTTEEVKRKICGDFLKPHNKPMEVGVDGNPPEPPRLILSFIAFPCGDCYSQSFRDHMKELQVHRLSFEPLYTSSHDRIGRRE